MHTALIRYWIEFAPREWFDADDEESTALPRACGVTAASLDDALALVREIVFRDQPLPPVRRVMEHVDTGMLEMFHVGPRVLAPGERGIWYPPIYHRPTDPAATRAEQ